MLCWFSISGALLGLCIYGFIICNHSSVTLDLFTLIYCFLFIPDCLGLSDKLLIKLLVEENIYFLRIKLPFTESHTQSSIGV